MIHHKNWPTLLAYTVSVILFVVVSGYAVIYATGYRLDFQDWTLRKTGVLAITSKPSGATVYLNDKKYSRRTPLTLRNMLPGAYEATLELANYRPFTKTIEITSGIATEEHNLDLVNSVRLCANLSGRAVTDCSNAVKKQGIFLDACFVESLHIK